VKELVNVFIPKLSENKFLAVTRASLDKLYGDMSALPGGGVEDGEDLKSAASREVREETGRNLVKISSEPILVTTPVLLGEQIKLYIFEGEVDSGDFSPTESDISGVNWVTPKTFIESLRKFGYPESEFPKFEKLLIEKGFTL